MSYQYESRVEEALSIKRRTLRDQVRLMILFKEADQAGVLEKFSNDINYTGAVAQNYLAAYRRFVELGALPEEFTDADRVPVTEPLFTLWGETYDSTLFHPRYKGVDRLGIDKAAEDLGLQGNTKAYDIAKNPRSMQAAIIGDKAATEAALTALATKVGADPEFQMEMARVGFTYCNPQEPVKPPVDRPLLDPWVERITTLRSKAHRFREYAFDDPHAPVGVYDAATAVMEDMLAVRDLIKGRRDMNDREIINHG